MQRSEACGIAINLSLTSTSDDLNNWMVKVRLGVCEYSCHFYEPDVNQFRLIVTVTVGPFCIGGTV
jgi:hypothetical protein